MKHRVASVDEIPEGGGIVVDVADKRVAVFRHQGDYYALDETCPHRGGPLHEGAIDEGVLSCPWHHWQFELETGCSPVNPLSKVATYPVRVEAGEVWVETEPE